MPPGEEDKARRFYRDVLGFTEVEKPEILKARGGCWFEAGCAELHLGVEQHFRPARKAHPAFAVSDLAVLIVKLDGAGIPVRAAEPLEGTERIYIDDPFGNRIELLQRL